MNAAQEILKLFEQIAAIPRQSKHEAQIAGWLQAWAAQRGFAAQTDPAGNLVIRVPASAGHENAPTLILQGHMDMVCEKTPDSTHNFATDPIRCLVDGDWLHADRTTLGADNGIGIALALALVDHPTVVHPPLELLFTVEEETGLDGALQLKPGFVSGKTLLNLDSETEGVFTVGCAGGKKTRLQLPLSFDPFQSGQAAQVAVGGLKGGHSGLDIDKQRASANKLLARLLGELRQRAPLRIAAIDGGTAHNAIPREALVTLVFDPAHADAIMQTVQKFQCTLQAEYALSEISLSVALLPAQAGRVLTAADSDKVIDLLQALPHGVHKMSARIAGFVETSNNLARIEMQGDTLHLLSSQRSSVPSQLDEITRRIEAVARLAGAQVVSGEEYPAWQPNLDSPLLKRSQEIYTRLFGAAPKVEALHAGLECGQIGVVFGEMDMLSLGATLLDPHSPAERLYIPSLNRVWDFLVAVLAAYATGQ